jgi:hypothetical protein
MLLDTVAGDLNNNFTLVFCSGVLMLMLSLFAFGHHAVVWWFAFRLIMLISSTLFYAANF